jgi:hypothetical protein
VQLTTTYSQRAGWWSHHREEAMGTVVTIDLFGDGDGMPDGTYVR